MKLAMIQMNSQPDRVRNLHQAVHLMEQAVRAQNPDLLVLPEHFDWSGGTQEQKRNAADHLPDGLAWRTISNFAARHRTWVHAGSMLERVPDQNRIYNTSVVFNANGEEVGRYRKIHMFDITTPSGRVYGESETVMPGSEQFTYTYCGLRIGCAICYDLRFSNLFWELARQKVDVIILPAAFTAETGQAHWEVLCRARAIEFQAYMVAVGQWGSYPSLDGRPRNCHGKSMVCGPWGQIVAQAPDGVGFTLAEIDLDEILRVRELIPMASHRRELSACSGCKASASPLRASLNTRLDVQNCQG